MDNLYFRAIRTTVCGTVVFLALIFIPAGTLDYWQGWAFAGTLLVPSILVSIYMAIYLRQEAPRKPPAHRAGSGKDLCAEGHHRHWLAGLCRGDRHHGS